VDERDFEEVDGRVALSKGNAYDVKILFVPLQKFETDTPTHPPTHTHI